MVPDIGHLAAIALIKMVHPLPARGHHPHRIILQDVAHQVEEMAAFFNQSAAGIAVEAVPVADLFQEGKAMLADRQHLYATGDSLRLFDQGGDGGHIAILHRHP
jgi:hypothetical protein